MTLTALLLVGAALAGDGKRGPWMEEENVPPSVTLSVAPLKLMDRPVLEGTAEFRVGEKRSFAITGSRALGARTVPMEVGVQVREYIAGNFGNGIALGAGAGFTNPNIMELRADSTHIGPFLAVKVTLALFSLEARGGPEVTFGRKGIELAPAVDLSAGISF